MKRPINPCKQSHDIAKPYIDNFRTAIDIGSKRGDYATLLKADFKNIECFDPRVVYDLQFWNTVGTHQKKKNKIRLHHCALGDIKKHVKMHGAVIYDDDWWEDTESTKPTLKPENFLKLGSNSTENKHKRRRVEQKTLDSFGFKDVDFIKIDVEGHELRVLKGAIETISTHRPTIILEENDRIEGWGKGKKFDAMDFLKTLGYNQVAFDGNMDYVMKFCS